MEWESYWQQLLSENRLNNKVEELDNHERDNLGQTPQTERICKEIYKCYDEKAAKLLNVKQDCVKELDKIEGIHLSSGRVKKRDSLLCKVINKRWENIAAFDSKYYTLNEFNYDKIITDLIGLRLIISYRGKWISIHRQILELFPLLDKSLYHEEQLLEHHLAKQFQAEWPKVYYAMGDSIQEYEDEGIEAKLKKTRYRSIHYILSFQETYIELQMRTIYDEAWSDCDHNYVYKKEKNLSHGALVEMSEILNELTNISSNLNDIMKLVYDNEGMIRNKQGNKWMTLPEHISSIDTIIDRLEVTGNYLKEFRGKLVNRQEESDETGK